MFSIEDLGVVDAEVQVLPDFLGFLESFLSFGWSKSHILFIIRLILHHINLGANFCLNLTYFYISFMIYKTFSSL